MVVREEDVKKGEKYLNIGAKVGLKIAVAAAIRKLMPKGSGKAANVLFTAASAFLGDVLVEQFDGKIEERIGTYKEEIETLAGGYQTKEDNNVTED